MDARVSTALRDAALGDDGPAWARAAQALLRVGEPERAAVAARKALARGTSAMDVLDAATPPLEAFVTREVEVTRDVGHRSGVAWLPTGGRLLALAPGPRGTSTLAALDLERDPAPVELLQDGIGALLAAAFDAPLVVVARSGQLRTLDLATGREGPPLGVRELGPGTGALSFAITSGPDALHVATARRARTLRLEGVEARVTLEVKRSLASFDATGALAYDFMNELHLHSPGQEAPRARAPLAGTPRRSTVAAGYRALVVDDDLALHGEDGGVLGRAPLVAPRPATRNDRLYRPCPSGRLALYVPAGQLSACALVDLRTGASRWFELRGTATDAAWSPSGRRVAITSSAPSRYVLLLEPA